MEDTVSQEAGAAALAESRAAPCVIVIFGGAGDLAERKLLPAIFDLFCRELLPAPFALVGCGRRSFSDDDYRDYARDAVQRHGRRAFDAALQAAVAELNDRHRPFSVVMLDVDYFKQFNDAHGHIAGDEVLRTLGKRLPQLIKSTDAACRYGGEEFAILFPHTGRAAAAARCRPDRQWCRCRRRIERWRHRGDRAGRRGRPVEVRGGRARRRRLGLEVRQLRDRDVELLAERLERERSVAGDAVHLHALGAELVEDRAADAVDAVGLEQDAAFEVVAIDRLEQAERAHADEVVELDRAASAPADLLVNGTLIARGEVVVVDEDFGLRISEIVTDAAAELGAVSA